MKNLIFFVLLIFMLGCIQLTTQDPVVNETYSVKEILASPNTFEGKQLRIIGETGLLACTKMYCSDDPCCNSCSGTLTDLDDDSSKINVYGKDCAFAGRDIGGGMSIFFGTLKITEGKPVFELDLYFEEGKFDFGKNFTVIENSIYKNESNGVGVRVDGFSSSLCPPGVQCVWAGENTIELTFIFNDAIGKQFSLGKNSYPSHQEGQYLIELVSLDYENKTAVLKVNIEQSIGCQEDARVCSDGSVVVREGPFCEFPECENEIVDEESVFLEKFYSMGFSPTPTYIKTSIFESGKVIIETTTSNYLNGEENETVSMQEQNLTSEELDELKISIIESGFLDADYSKVEQCIMDIPITTLTITLNGKKNEVSGLGAECDSEKTKIVREILEKVNLLIE